MKTRGFLILCSLLLLLNGCSTSNSQSPVVAQMAIETIHYERPYKFSIVQAKGSSTHIDEKPSYSGAFDLVVQDGNGKETSRKSLNRYFGNMELTIDGPIKLTVQDYNGFLISQAELVQNGQRSSIKIIQTEYKKPRTPDEPGFSIDERMYRGRFDILSQDSAGKVISRIPLTTYFGKDDLGFGGSFSLVFEDYNQDGNFDFAIGQPLKNSPEFQFVLFSINPEGTVYKLPAVGYKEGGYVYSAEAQARFPLLKEGETGFDVTLSDLAENGFTQGKYVWNGSKFVFTDSD